MQTLVERIPVNDGSKGEASLSATFFVPDAPRASVLLPPAMGVTQKFYGEFAAWLGSQGFLTATFDYRGMGRSAQRSLRVVDVDVSGWARVDCAAVIDVVKRRLPHRPLFVIGHSLGGQLLGMIPNRGLIDGAMLVASGSGYWRETSPRTQRSSPLLWYVLIPLLTPLFGYFPGKMLRVVGNLPRGVIEQWRRWCMNPEYMIGAEGGTLRADFADLRIPMLSLSFTDDEMMSAKSTAALHAFYSGATIESVRLDPADASAKHIGHFGFFRSKFEERLWPLASRWLERHS